jgi:rare lipoprotein A
MTAEPGWRWGSKPWFIILAIAGLVANGCGHRQQAASVPSTAPANSTTTPSAQASSEPPSAPPSARIPVTELPEGGISEEDRDFILSHKPIYSETGQATWYVAPYKGRKAANGQVFRDDALTAAHRTLPMGSLVVVEEFLSFAG